MTKNPTKNHKLYVEGPHRPIKTTSVQLRLNRKRFWGSSKENGRNLRDSIEELSLVSCSVSFFVEVNRKKQKLGKAQQTRPRVKSDATSAEFKR